MRHDRYSTHSSRPNDPPDDMSGSIKKNVDTANMEHALTKADAVKDGMFEDEESMVEEMPEEHPEQPHGQ